MNQKAITLWQPWASLIALGAKEYETRGWRPRVQVGETLHIHAAKQPLDKNARELFYHPDLVRYWAIAGYETPDDMPFGAIVCETVYKGAHTTDGLIISNLERLLGNYAPKRYAWELDLVQRFDPAIPAQGRQSIWAIDAALLQPTK